MEQDGFLFRFRVANMSAWISVAFFWDSHLMIDIYDAIWDILPADF
jgi:hypothetical protein